MNIVICGGGNLGHALAGKLSLIVELKVSVLTTKPFFWHNRVDLIENNGVSECSGLINVTENPSEVIPDADIVLVTVPSFLLKEILQSIAPHLNRESVWVGSVQCFGGFFLMASQMLGANCNLFGFQRVPYIARIKEYGKSVCIRGYKIEHRIAALTYNKDKLEIKNILQALFDEPVIMLRSFLEVTLTNSNPLLHPARLYSVMKSWNAGDTFSSSILFYEEWDDFASEILIKMDNELQLLVNDLSDYMDPIVPIDQYYGVEGASDLTQKIREIEAFKQIKFPMVFDGTSYIPDLESRYFIEDIPFGLLIIKSIGEQRGIKMPVITEVINWYERIMGKCYLVNGVLEGPDVFETGVVNGVNEILDLRTC